MRSGGSEVHRWRSPGVVALVSLVALTAFVVTGRGAAAQERDGGDVAPTAVRGRVLVGPDSVPAGGAVVVLEGRPRVRTDPDGRFLIPDAPGGAVRVLSVMIPRAGGGMVTSTARFRIPHRQSEPFTWWVAVPAWSAPLDEDEVFDLEGLDVTVRSGEGGAAPRTRAERRDALTREDILEHEFGARDVGDLVRQFLGLRVLPTGDPAALRIVPTRRSVDRPSIVPYRESACPGMVTVVLNGVVVRDAEYLLPTLSPDEIQTIEFLETTSAGLRYGAGGALVIRTRTR